MYYRVIAAPPDQGLPLRAAGVRMLLHLHLVNLRNLLKTRVNFSEVVHLALGLKKKKMERNCLETIWRRE